VLEFDFDDPDFEIKINRNRGRNLFRNIFDFIQYYKGIMIESRGVQVFTDEETGETTSITDGTVPKDVLDSIDVNPGISIEESKQIVMSRYNFGISELKEPELLIRYDNYEYTLTLVWKVFTNNEDYIEVVLCATTGDTIFVNSMIARG
jgi:Zn-dependent metalloprotease